MYLIIILTILLAINALEESRVYNGADLDPTEHGYLVLIRIFTEDNFRIKCSGSIIRSNWILTAAHCLPAQKPITKISVLQYTNEVNRTIAKVTPKNAFAHPKYIPGRYTFANTQYDIALLKTSKQIVFDEHAWLIEPARFSPRSNQSAILSGYGLNELNESLPRQGVVRITKCPFANSGRLLCSIGKVKSGGGDSGGPLTSKGKLIGVISGTSNNNCEETNPESSCTSIYVNVATHYEWIKKVTQEFTTIK